MTEYPSIYHPDIGEYIEIRNELAFKAARVVWDDIAAKYSNISLDQQTVRVIPDMREENLAKAVIPSDELKKPVKVKADGRKVKDSTKIRNTHNKWTDEEMLVIQDLPSWKDAVAVYQKAFPDKRNKNSVEQQWKKISQGIVKKRTPSAPTLTIPANSGMSGDIEIVGAGSLLDNLPTEPTASRKEIRQGCKVKQIGGTKIFTGTGTVKRCPNGKDEVLVQFDNGLEWFSRKNLTLVEAAP